jgi:prepilin-type N-terminal cleavage/methylation domain-containing protein
VKAVNNRLAFTLVEILVVVAIISILAILIVPNFTQIQGKAEGVVCNFRLRNLYTAFSTYMADGNPWPQIPANIPISSVAEQQWWLNTTAATMNLSAKDWSCPTIARYTAGAAASSKGNVNLICYYPTLFDARPMTPMSSLQMPWFTEVLSVHGNGNLSIRADGSVLPLLESLKSP